ncbi:MAG: ribonuclease H-like domain-containing protein, partial [Chloroflexota bacterium]
SDFKAKLKRMGVVKGARNLKPAPKPVEPFAQSLGHPNKQSPQDTLKTLAELFPNGRVIDEYSQSFFEVDEVFPLSQKVGPSVLQNVANLDLSPAAEFAGDERLRGMTGRDLLFVDLETTGLAGAGVQPFMIGLAFFEGDALIVRQYFMHQPAAEEGMLIAFERLLSERRALVTFNGKTFDLPVLDTRFVMTGLMDGSRPDLVQLPHLDLLQPARRIWSHLPSRSLSYLDEHVLKMKRPPGEIPGRMAPWLYNQYAQSGDPRPLEGMFLHNNLDMLAMVPLVEQVVNHWTSDVLPDNPYIALSVCRWKLNLGEVQAAEIMLADFLSRAVALPIELRLTALRELSLLLKKQDRRGDAIALWQEMAELDQIEDVFPHLELAKFYEWHAIDLEKASMWSAHAYQIVISRPVLDFVLKNEIEHRLRRLANKMRKKGEGNE